MAVQSVWKSVLFWLGLVSAVAEGVLGVLMTSGTVSAELGGSILTGLAVVLGFCNANNPSSPDQYIMRQEESNTAALSHMAPAEEEYCEQPQITVQDIQKLVQTVQMLQTGSHSDHWSDYHIE